MLLFLAVIGKLITFFCSSKKTKYSKSDAHFHQTKAKYILHVLHQLHQKWQFLDIHFSTNDDFYSILYMTRTQVCHNRKRRKWVEASLMFLNPDRIFQASIEHSLAYLLFKSTFEFKFSKSFRTYLHLQYQLFFAGLFTCPR